MIVLLSKSCKVLIFTVVLGAFTCSQAQVQQSQPNGLDNYLQRQMQARHIPGMQVAIVRHGKIVFEGSYGIADLQNSVPVTRNTVFPIFSITKTFTGVAAMQLVETGKLDLEAPVSRYLDGLPLSWQSVTIRQLLTHTSGLPNILDNETGALISNGERAAWEKVTAMPMEFAPGEKFSYCQTNYMLIGRIIDKLSGEAFTRFIAEKQLAIAGMKNTAYGDGHAVLPHGIRDYSLASGFKGDASSLSGYENLFIEFSPSLLTAAGMNSTADDMARWVIALQAVKFFKDKDSLGVLWTPGQLNDGSHQGFSTFVNGYALGWPVVLRPRHRAMAALGGGHAAIFVYPDDDMSVILLTNLKLASPEVFVDEVVGFFIPEMKAENGFGLPPAIGALRAELVKRGFGQASQVVKDLKTRDASFQFAEDDLNTWAYQLLEQKRFEQAIAIFQLNVELYPHSANAYDSLAKGYEDNGNKDLAIYNYKRSLELNPNNTNATEHLTKLHAPM
jgi:CubicO group peptidase (beta-lactamase class C family)